MPQPALSRAFPMTRSRLALVAALLIAFISGISWLGLDVLRQIDQESESRTDNAQWALSQIEVELLYLMAAADSAHHGTVSMDALRLRYDIFYSRLQTLRFGRVFGGLRDTAKYTESMARLSAFMAAHLPYVDGPDDALQAHLPMLFADTKAMIGDARVVALAGVKVIARVSDQRRIAVNRTLILAGLLTIFLVAFLVALVVLLWRLIRFNRLRAVENLANLTRLDAVVATALEALITVNAQGRIIEVNEAACQTFGYARQEVVGADMTDLVAGEPDGQALFVKDTAPAVEGRGRFRITARHKDGHHFPAEVSISHIKAGEDALFVAFLHDLSAQLAAEQALVAARDEALAGEKAKADLLVVMSHEIRTPLNGMIGTIELLDETDLKPHQREYLRIMQASGKLLMHHVNDVLDIARLDSGKARFLSGPVDLADLGREVIENQLPAGRDNGNALTFDGPSDGRNAVVCDGALLRQVLLNLVGNAVKFTRNGQISVSILHKGPDGPTEISVRDTGIGIPKADLDRIFDDFVTLDASYSRRSSGTGLGLGIVKRIVGQMGGTLAVHSESNQGSLFRVTLPLKIRPVADPGPQRDVRPQGAQGAGPQRVILVVEDNDFNRLIMHDMLGKEGYEVVEARDGFEGITLAAARRFDLILMDISMPRVDGLQAATAIRTGQGASRMTPIVAMTAHALADETARFRADGMADILVKPITREALRAALNATATDATPLGAVLDRAVLQSLSDDLGQTRAQTLVRKFRAETTRIIRDIGDHLARTAPDQALIRDLHRLEGSAAMFGASGLQKLLSDVQTAWKTGSPDQAAQHLAQLQGIWLATEAAFHEASLAQPSSLR